MIIGGMILFGILALIFGIMCEETYNDSFGWFCLIFFIFGCIVFGYGCMNGFIYYPATEGTHQGLITAVDLEGVYFRRYEIYLKSDGFTSSSKGNLSNETKYLIYEDEKELAEQLKDAIGKEVKLTYGHDGGYIGWKSCGTYHIKSFEIIEEK